MYSLDTNIIIDFLRGENGAVRKIEELKQTHILSITPIVLSELYKGAFLGARQEEIFSTVEQFSKSLVFLEYTEEACKIFGEKFAELKKIGKPTEESDLMIASICIAKDSILVTKNYKHFKDIKGLRLLAV